MCGVNGRDYVRVRGPGSWAIAAVWAVASGGGCFFGTETSRCETADRRCQPGQVCAARQDVCIDLGGCGDGLISAEQGEVCDDGNILDGDGCSADCTSDETCGNGTTDAVAKESCDDGNRVSGDGCTSECIREICGNRILDVHEDCDAGPMDSQGCDGDCSLVECGDGHANLAAGEECDTGGVVTPDCNSRCRRPLCGDSFYDPDSEQCDTGGDSLACDQDCTRRECGDDYINSVAGELCETKVDSQACDDDCTLPACGDGHWNPNHATPEVPLGEQCDTSGDSQTCDKDCTLRVCGDGYINAAAGEECDNNLCGSAQFCSNCKCVSSVSSGPGPIGSDEGAVR